MGNRGEIIVLRSLVEIAEEAARQFFKLAEETITRQGWFSVALSGGNTPRVLHELLARPPLRNVVEWSHVHVFWGDERFVPADNPESNFRMARESLLDHVPIPAENIHPVPTGEATAEEAARRYAETLKEFFDANTPKFDLIFLGMGPDGHTASLFPGYWELQSGGNTIVSVVKDAPKPPPVRITLTLNAINNAANVIFLVTGRDKAEAVKSVMEGALELPATKVQPVRGKLLWLLDEAAAQRLRKI
jgi:6-phosphogluconolactonase